MAKHVLYGDITSTAKQPYLKQTHAHYNDMINELSLALGETIVSDSSKVTILYGCENTGTGTGIGDTAIISEGAVYYNGEIYKVPAFTAAPIVNGLLGTITTSWTAADPVLFSDSNTYNVHQIKTIVISDATASGDFAFSNWKSIKRFWNTYTLTNSDLAAASGTLTINSATRKELIYNVDYKSRMIHINIFIAGANASVGPVSSFYVKLPPGITQSNIFYSVGTYTNTTGGSEASGATKQTATRIQTIPSYGVNWMQIAPVRSSYENFDTNGSNCLNFNGQISIPF